MTSKSEKPPVPSNRAQAETFFGYAQENLADAEETASGTLDQLSELGWAQAHLLKAIYFELRHGHDRAAETAAALDEHADAMDHLGSDMRGLGDALSRHR
ncbi:hypothetical protein [Amycolatopsis sp. NPDC059657]|uniref:hypothetical protein n=1 Tax=Amycolatopsis sp. NPDC059657 TaxID=3346899 RepID=UPI00366EFE28